MCSCSNLCSYISYTVAGCFNWFAACSGKGVRDAHKYPMVPSSANEVGSAASALYAWHDACGLLCVLALPHL